MVYNVLIKVACHTLVCWALDDSSRAFNRAVVVAVTKKVQWHWLVPARPPSLSTPRREHVGFRWLRPVRKGRVHALSEWSHAEAALRVWESNLDIATSVFILKVYKKVKFYKLPVLPNTDDIQLLTVPLYTDYLGYLRISGPFFHINVSHICAINHNGKRNI